MIGKKKKTTIVCRICQHSCTHLGFNSRQFSQVNCIHKLHGERNHHNSKQMDREVKVLCSRYLKHHQVELTFNIHPCLPPTKLPRSSASTNKHTNIKPSFPPQAPKSLPPSSQNLQNIISRPASTENLPPRLLNGQTGRQHHRAKTPLTLTLNTSENGASRTPSGRLQEA